LVRREIEIKAPTINEIGKRDKKKRE